MKTIFAMAFAAAFATSATVGTLSDPVIEAPVIVEHASSSNSGTVTVALLALLLALPALTD